MKETLLHLTDCLSLLVYKVEQDKINDEIETYHVFPLSLLYPTKHFTPTQDEIRGINELDMNG